MAGADFYADLTVLDDFSEVTDLSRYRELPADWQVIVADILGSTRAVQAGQYKAVNILGVSVITAIVNMAMPVPVPYIFGGDGASLCIPETLAAGARAALIATKMLADEAFGLNLRVGIIPAAVINRSGLKILVAKHRMSPFYIQAAFAGGGIEYAERLLKDEEAGAAFRLQAMDGAPEADFSGMECRWDNVPSRHGEIIALIVKAMAPDMEKEAAIYNEIIARVRHIYGDDDVCRPIHVSGLGMTNDGWKLSHETRIRTFSRGKIAYILYLLKIRVQNVLGWFFMEFALHIGGTPWGDYKKDLVTNTDFKKFDGVLRTVMSGTAAQRQELTDYLEELYRRRECVYGLHASATALITCLISKRSGYHNHFVDGADGGYAQAALAMKERLKTFRQ